MLFFIFAIGLFLSWLIPLHFPPWVSWHLEALAFLVVFLLTWAGVFRLIKKGQSRAISFPSLALPFIALAILAVGQFATGLMTFGGDALVFAFYMALCVMCLALGFASSRQALSIGPVVHGKGNENPALTFLAFTLVLGALASAVVAFAQVFELWEQSSWISRMPSLRRPGGNLAQPNQLATLLVMGVASLVFLHRSKKLGALTSGLLLFLLCAGISVTESRTGALSLLALLGWWLVKRRSIGDRTPRWVGVGCGIVFVGMFLAWPQLLNSMLFSDQAAVNTTSSLRLDVWSQLVEAVALRPWWGWGINEVAKAHNAVVHSYAVSAPFTYSHNIVLDLALWVGLPLTGALVLVTGVWLWRRVRAANQLLPWYGLAVVLPVAVHSMLEFPFAYAYFLVPVMFVLGALEGMAGGKPALSIGVRPAAALLLVVSSVAAWSVVEYVAIEEDFRVARFEALRLGQTPSNYQRPQVVLLTQLSALLDGARIKPKPGMTEDELDLAKKVALRYPWTATQNRYALSLALNGNPEEATRQLLVMQAMHGEKTYNEIKANWRSLAQEKYPQLRTLALP